MDWEDLFETHADDLIRICWRILGSRADVDDCVQETFIQAFQADQRETIRNWPGLLRRIAVMTALAMLRKRKKLRRDAAQSPQQHDPPSRDATPDELAVGRELEEHLRREVSRLPDREAMVFCLRYFEGLSVQETARTLSISAAAVSAAAHRARRELERRMNDLVATPSSE